MPEPDCRLDSDWNPEAKRLTLTLVNHGREPLSGFRLAFTSLLRIKGAESVAGGALVEQLSNSHVIAPPDGFVLSPGASWTVTADKVSHDLRHYTYGPKTAWLILADGRKVVVDPTPMTRGGVPGTPSPAPAPTGPLPPDAPPIAVIPHPASVSVEGARDTPSALTFAGGPPEPPPPMTPSRRWRHGSSPASRRSLPRAALPAAPRPTPASGRRRIACSSTATECGSWRRPSRASVTGGSRSARFSAAPGSGRRRSSFPCSASIDDAPRFAFRGAHLDVARQFYPADEVARFIDCLAWNKLNVLHLHLSDDEGWRLDIPGYPELAAVAAWRGDGLAVPPLLGSGLARYGGFYSADDIESLVAHAGRARHRDRPRDRHSRPLPLRA